MSLTNEGLISVPGMMSRWVRLGNGAKCHYMTAGETGPAIVLLHGGIPGSSGVAGFRFTAPFLGANGFRVYCPDQPGFGHADAREEYWPRRGILDQIDFVERFADALCLDEFCIAGNSMGCITSSHYIVRYPHRIKRFALIAGFIGDHVPMQGTIKEQNRSPVEPPKTIEDMRRMMRSIIGNEDAISDDLLQMRFQAAQRQKDSWNAWQSAVLHGNASKDIALALSTKDRIDKLEVPGIYMYPLNDVILPVEEQGYRQEDALPRVQFFYVENCGHQGQTDRPEVFNQVFLEWFRDGKITRKTADVAGVSKRRPENPSIVERA